MRVIKFLLDMLVFYEMYRIVWVFLKIKITLMKRKDQPLTILTYVSIIYVYLVISVNFFHTLMWQINYILI